MIKKKKMDLKSKESLKTILWKVENSKTDFNKQEKDCLKEVYDEIQSKIGKSRRLDLSCSGCLLSAIGIVKNYLNYHGGYDFLKQEEKQQEKKAKVYIVRADENDESDQLKKELIDLTDEDLDRLSKMTLKELRMEYPTVKGRSVSDFIDKLRKRVNTF